MYVSFSFHLQVAMKPTSIIPEFRILLFLAVSLMLFFAIRLEFRSDFNWISQSARRKSYVTRDEEKDNGPLVCPMPALQSGDQIRQILTTVEMPCGNTTTFGGPPRGKKGSSKNVCLDAKFGITPGSCVVFSFGINHDWSFEDEMAEFGCKVFAYDPTMDVEDHQRSPNLRFFATGIANFNGTKIIGMGKNWKERKVNRFENLVKEAGMEGVAIDVVKLDVELSELDFFQDMLFNSRHVLKNIKQLAVEIHSYFRSQEVNSLSRHQVFWPYLNLLRCAGFKLISSEAGGYWREVVWAQDRVW
ncbi:uncharacterized protein LOC122250661 [Penaeus japonicus]|uniref:uncharacterized protein LOC122250661 n=1 Tax=Penaeus japonicus TaxID=27405 RepID=UPI001C710E1A|nr:uncharacterized protein LOC122250661 [Penaeus japonicus]